LPAASLTDVTVVESSSHPTITTFKSPAACAPEYVTVTDDWGDCGHAKLLWTLEARAAAVWATRSAEEGNLAQAISATRHSNALSKTPRLPFLSVLPVTYRSAVDRVKSGRTLAERH
jgi:hypothetical protein